MTTTRRRRTASNSGTEAGNGSASDYRADLWKMADALRGSMDAAEYKHVVLGLIFLKYISDAFEERHSQLMAEVDNGADPEEPDEYRAESIFWVPQEARWLRLQGLARQPEIGSAVDEAMTAIERDNDALTGCPPQGLCPPCPGQDPPRPGRRSRQQHQDRWR